uniref:EF-hand domain-containing protein n=1 Tax=Florenciella parvula TaxID=236787 RepID=A0A7S2BEW1_9STRA|eukprot:CAMPEP_0119542206 /NCGR_PEP_ID=MMETSP1344-20130328/53444_1 /TAXON_ID=236787 /ORGANISM="Florenciella parvula, Strain CCMP2471" /LENGTH=211 /DNA_ID=CAMNT_0007586375 /DNA_START=49 /DNA_END=684 /DNA_ORIENTATION=-
MGNSHGGSRVCKLKKKEIKALVAKTHFSVEEIKALWLHFRLISSSEKDDNLIDRVEFQKALGLKNSTFVDRMFAIFDADGDGGITFTEFLECLSGLSSKAAPEEKLNFSFKIYDMDGDNVISVQELTDMLRATADENDLVLDENALSSVVASTFAEIPNHNDHITLAQYTDLLADHPMMLSQLTLNISALIAEQLQGGEIPLEDQDGAEDG